MPRQILAFLGAFLGILVYLALWYQLPHVNSWFAERSVDLQQLLLAVAVWALAGGISCLFLSRHIADWAMKVDLLPLDQQDKAVSQAENVLRKVAHDFGLTRMPQLGVYERRERNAFIVGMGPGHSTLAVSRGLLDALGPEELEAIFIREILQLKSRDTLLIAFIQGMNFAFTLYVARMLAFLLGTSLRATEEEATSSDAVEVFINSILTLLLTLPGSLVLWAFSRSSAFRADAAAAKVLGTQRWTATLSRLQGDTESLIRREIFSDAFKLLSRPYPTWAGIIAVHPSLATRIYSLQQLPS